jgi:hypothetical protein
MTELSPTAQAVYNAVLDICPAPADEIAATVLRTAADQLTPNGYAWSHRSAVRSELLAIADELENFATKN